MIVVEMLYLGYALNSTDPNMLWLIGFQFCPNPTLAQRLGLGVCVGFR